MLPFGILLVLSNFLDAAVAQQQSLEFDTIQSSTTVPATFDFPSPATRTEPVFVSITLCNINANGIEVFISNRTASNDQPETRLEFLDGLATWKGVAPDGGVIRIGSSGSTDDISFEVAASTADFVHNVLQEAPLLGDTTPQTALLFSTASAPVEFSSPSFPNYTLPDPTNGLPLNSPESDSTDFLVLVPTSASSDASRRSRSACALRQTPDTIEPRTTIPWPRNKNWRTQWLLADLTPQTNYTAWSISGSKVSLPASFLTKSPDFACPLVHSLPFCPAVSWAAPLPPLPADSEAITYTEENFPSRLRETLIGSVTNFSSVLSTFACGRDLYSIVQSCDTCVISYRDWLCSTLIPRCGEQQQQTLDPPPALLQRQVPRLPDASEDGSPTSFTELLPCLETCHSVDRACPPLIGWKCPIPKVNANQSYGVGFIDDGYHEKGGNPGFAQDRFGNVWCNS